MNSKIAITAIALVAVIMGMSAAAPAIAQPPVGVPPAPPGPPAVDCDALEKFLDRLVGKGTIDDDDKDAALKAADCPTD